MSGVACPKCGSQAVTTRWHRGGGFSDWYGDLCGYKDEGRSKSEHLHRYCSACRFDWSDPTLDRSADTTEAG